ncbi:hypothetical protein HC891_16065 [Candidatus Gracilibacteria bacterium]|nr:hypothetical protein [Candidatus Gracilibacteria bacterium]
MSSRVETSTPPHTPHPIGPYNHIAKVGQFITIGGTAGFDPASGELAGPDVSTQTRQILTSFAVMLASVGSDLEHIVHCNVFLKDMGDFDEMNRAYSEQLGNHRPARTVIGVAELPKPGVLLTMNVTAVTSDVFGRCIDSSLSVVRYDGRVRQFAPGLHVFIQVRERPMQPIRSIVAVLLAALLLTLVGCGAPPVTFAEVPVHPEMTPMERGSNSIADAFASSLETSLTERGTVELQLYSVPNAVMWEEIDGFYSSALAESDWKLAAELQQESAGINTTGWMRGSFASEQGLMVGYAPDMLGDGAFLIVALFSEG